MPRPPRRPAPSPWRPATAADRRAVIRLSLALFTEDPGTRPMTARTIGRTLTVFENEPARGQAVVAVVDGVVVGYALLASFWSNELHGEVCTIDELYVDDAHRGAGLGTALVHRLVGRGLPRFARAVAFELEVTPTNHRARALYIRLGFSDRKNATMRLLHPHDMT